MKRRVEKAGATVGYSAVFATTALLLTAVPRLLADSLEFELQESGDLQNWEKVALMPEMLSAEGTIRIPRDEGRAFLRMAFEKGENIAPLDVKLRAWTDEGAGDSLELQLETFLQEVGWSQELVDVDLLSGEGRLQIPLDESPPEGFVWIPSGNYMRGDHKGELVELPVHEIYTSGFHLAETLVSYAEWKEVLDWALENGYELGAGQRGSAHINREREDTPENNRHPVVKVNWYSALKWCNARSEMEGLDPVYYTDDVGGEVYRIGVYDVGIDQVDWHANGYRLPTDAEWEKAARGGLEGKRWPWGDDGIDPTYANYSGSLDNLETAPVGSYPPNAFGVYDMIGNAREWCWDYSDLYWYSKFGSIEPDSRGPEDGFHRVLRGGSWSDGPWKRGSDGFQMASRVTNPPGNVSPSNGLRVARSARSFRANRILSIFGDLSFRNVTVGDSATRELQLSNLGNRPLNVTGIDFPADFAGDWTGEIPPGESRTVTVTFQPGTAGGVSDEITVESDNATGGHDRVSVTGTGLDEKSAPEGFVFIPPGTYSRGDHMNEWNDQFSASRPVHDARVSGFYLARAPVTYEEWVEVYDWAEANGYEFLRSGERGATSTGGALPDTPENNRHPVVSVTWNDVVKWCNAKSEMEGLSPVYYTDAEKTSVYREGQQDLFTENVLWSANGYRLPTETEWERAARGWLHGKRWAWGDEYINDETKPGGDLRANHRNSTSDNGTTVVDRFPPNGFGLFDMAGNVWEFCWDWFDADWYGNAAASELDSRGPESGSGRALRGGSWLDQAFQSRVAFRSWTYVDSRSESFGFRIARSAKD